MFFIASESLRMASMQKLSADTVRLITSTQVITSIVSITKELIENSLDAGSDNIEVKLVSFTTYLEIYEMMLLLQQTYWFLFLVYVIPSSNNNNNDDLYSARIHQLLVLKVHYYPCSSGT